MDSKDHAATPPRSEDSWIVFSSRRTEYACAEIGFVRPDGTGLHFPHLDIEGQVSWHAGPAFAGGDRIILHSVENSETWKHRSRSNLWIYQISSGELTALPLKHRPADFMPPALLLPGDERIVVNPVIQGNQCVVTMNLDGSDPVHVTKPEDGFAYGIALSPDCSMLAFHIAGPPNYFACVADIDGANRRVVARDPDVLFFAPMWSRNGDWLVCEGCFSGKDPEHFAADLYLVRPDGRELRPVTSGQSHWFAAAYGDEKSRSGGSNVSRWSPNEDVVSYTRLAPGSRTAWKHIEQPQEDDHFNRAYAPEEARGGTQLCALNPFERACRPLTEVREGVWDMRAAWSSDGALIAFCRAHVGQPPGLWVMSADGGQARLLTVGKEGLGADHPAWIHAR
ncbi:MAG TPA: serine/threonine protein kinase [Candidatus Latescibacteria bacterium]|nr:serine/threonine protein kinase [Candidatus Latescibacterota bacterium]